MAKSKKARRLDELAAQIRVCTRCPLHESRTHAVPGDGSYAARVMIIGGVSAKAVLGAKSVGELRGKPVARDGRRYIVGYHPVEYLKFEGHIPEGEYGAGEHIRWDEGTYESLGDTSALEQLEASRLDFELKGERLRGAFTLVRMNGREGQWLLMKRTDVFAERGCALKLREPVDGKDTIEGKTKGKRQKTEVKSEDAGVRKFDVKKAAKGARIVAAGRALKSKSLEGDLNVRVAGAVVPLTHLERVYWPDEGYTKGDLVSYYHEGLHRRDGRGDAP